MKRTHFALPEIYDDSLSYYDVLRKLIKSMHVFSDNLNKIPEQIANEAKARLLSDQNLQQNINTEVSAREQADTALQQNINSEATTREQADTALQNAVNNEKSAREQADQEIREGVSVKISELKRDIDAEANERKEADNAINAALDSHGTRLNALESYTIGVDSEGYIGVTYNGE